MRRVERGENKEKRAGGTRGGGGTGLKVDI